MTALGVGRRNAIVAKQNAEAKLTLARKPVHRLGRSGPMPECLAIVTAVTTLQVHVLPPTDPHQKGVTGTKSP